MPQYVQPLPTKEFLHSRLRYDAVHGHIYWRNGQCAMRRADSEMQNGYARVRFYIEGRTRTFPAHRIVWKMIYGADPQPEVDHIDQDRTNNRQFNLRLATKSENASNRSFKKRNLEQGIYATGSGRYRVQVMINRKTRHLGTYASRQEALAVLVAAKTA